MRKKFEPYINGNKIEEKNKVHGPYQIGEKGFLLIYSKNQLTTQQQFVSELSKQETDNLSPADILNTDFMAFK